ncbi:MAG: diacylglycerol kinase family lipid kinase [Spirochaetes bacterium]|jgi:YegS/Rv2252/BmrU family lipid kinase|nr:diacylglycerol kinase family lipid kinase [Spirochaetota bacterium]
MKKNDKWAFIINPIAGGGKAGRYAPTVREMIRRHGITAETAFTTGKGHATTLAADFAKRGFSHVVAVGGDGTFSEAAHGLVGKKNVIFGAMPAGTGNDFIAITGFSETLTDVEWETFFACHTARMDVGQCNDMHFINGMGLGFDAQVAWENYNSKKHEKVKGGDKSKYMWHILKTLVLYRETTMSLTAEGSVRPVKSFLNTIANGRRLAGGLYLTPEALADDGLLDICMIHELSFAGRIKELIHVIRGTHLKDSVVRFFRTDRLTIEFASEVPSHLDGELYFNSRFEIRALPGALNIIYNPAGKHFFGKATK